ncbi:MAG: hypothetical protein ACRDG3_07375 [Tepidiformaceae bacterium]
MSNASNAYCPDCGSAFSLSDNYCRECGMFLAALRPASPAMPLVKSQPPLPARVERQRASLPAPVKKAATALAIGTALQIGANVAGRYFIHNAARSVVKQAGQAVRPETVQKRGKKAEQVHRSPDPLQNAAAVSETVIVRRVWIRRG